VGLIVVVRIGLYLKLDITGRNSSNWSHEGWLHNGVYYPTSKDFRHAFENGKVEMTTRNIGANETWIGTDRDGPELKYDERPPPQQIAPGGQRFAVDEDAQYVEWMDFSFYWGFSRDTGMKLWDLKYKGERIVYELGLTEAIAHSESYSLSLISLNVELIFRFMNYRRRKRSRPVWYCLCRYVLCKLAHLPLSYHTLPLTEFAPHQRPGPASPSLPISPILLIYASSLSQ
jgi:hypothetical protein